MRQKGRLFFFLLLNGGFLSFAQPTVTFIKDIPVPDIRVFSMDRYGQIFIGDEHGQVHKYNEKGEFLLSFSPLRQGTVHLIDAWNTIRIFAFYRDFQQFIFFDRFLTLEPVFSFDPALVSFARTACLANDRSIWVFDDGDFGLKKYNPTLKKIDIYTPLELILNPSDYDINFIREYQNQVYLNDKNKGIMVFDNLGTYKKRIPIDSLGSFGFEMEKLIYFKNGLFGTFDLYDFTIEETRIPTEKSILGVLKNEENLFLFYKGGFEKYQYKKP